MMEEDYVRRYPAGEKPLDVKDEDGKTQQTSPACAKETVQSNQRDGGGGADARKNEKKCAGSDTKRTFRFLSSTRLSKRGAESAGHSRVVLLPQLRRQYLFVVFPPSDAASRRNASCHGHAPDVIADDES